MNIYFHVLINSIDARLGGMESSAQRIVKHFLDLGKTRVTVYERNSDNLPALNDVSNQFAGEDNIEIIQLNEIKSVLAKPLNPITFENNVHENARLDKLCLTSLIKEKQQIYSECKHLIVSFYISGYGFIAQHLANELQIPHIACVRGTDFNKDFFSPYRFSSVEFVLKNAKYIVTTNQTQEKILTPFLGKETEIKTIYNSIPEELNGDLWKHRSKDFVRIVADCGYSYKKSTQILLKVISELSLEGLPIKLMLAGSTDPSSQDFWTEQRNTYKKMLPEVFDFNDYLSREQIHSVILDGDIYCSATIGEGCSNGSLLALNLGIPIVATKTGAIGEIAEDDSSIFLSEPSDIEKFKNNLRSAVTKCLNGDLKIERNIEEIRKLSSTKKEKFEWANVISDVLPKKITIQKSRQKRVLFYVHNGTGLGHLRRLSRLASAIQGECACLVVSGHRAASFIVGSDSEYVHLPSYDNLIANKSRYWGRKPFMEISRENAVKFRTSLINSTIELFEPDVIVVDYLPLGKYQELSSIISNHPAKKYFIMRGVMDHSDNVHIDALNAEGENALEEYYDRILVACDEKICDVVKEYNLSQKISTKLNYIGYVSEPVSRISVDKIRRERGLNPKDIWVVCSAGGGALGEKFISECEKLSQCFPNFHFDIVIGPRSSLNWEFLSGETIQSGNVRLHRECHHMSSLNAAGDIVICSGGYNSLVEAMEGGKRIICVPVQHRTNDEQYIHPHRLKNFYPIEIVTDLYELSSCLKKVTQETDQPGVSIRTMLNFEGIDNFQRIILSDLNAKSNGNNLC
jgi:predicted glycosyltransferase